MNGDRNFRHRRQKRNAEKFVMLPANLFVRPEFANLPPAARVIYVNMAKLYRPPWDGRPGNNGKFWYGCRQGSAAAKMLHRIEESGAASITSRTTFNKKDSHKAQTWELAIYTTYGVMPRWNSERHVELYNWMTEAPAYVALSSGAKCILWELMRRYDGANNGIISFGGQDGAHAKLSRDVTERALTEIECARFIVVTEPAIPYLKRPRKWRLTMYPAYGKPASKDFMKAGSLPPQNSLHGEPSADDSAATVNPMRITNLPLPAARDASVNEDPSISLALPGRKYQPSHPRVLHVAPPSHPRTVHTSIEAMSGEHAARAAAPLATGQRTGSSPRPVMLANPLSETRAGLQSQPGSVSRPDDLFGAALAKAAAPMELLRGDLREVLARQRGTQSRLAIALRISRHTLSNAINGRERFSPTAAAALRQWLDGNPISEAWPPLPPREENAA
jgi:plasmid maintenance system antidote protein VapI